VLVKTTRGLMQAVRGLSEAYEMYRSSCSLTASKINVMASTSIYVGAVWTLDILFGCLKYKVFKFLKNSFFIIGLSDFRLSNRPFFMLSDYRLSDH
jgi:hypothetical protein